MACTIEDLNPSEIIVGCTDPLALNYDENATVDNGLCVYSGQTSGCTDPSAINYNPEAIFDDCSCVYIPCPSVSAITVSNGVVYYTKPSIPTPPPLPPGPLETDKSQTQGPLLPATTTTATPGKTPSSFIPVSEYCCTEDIVGQPVEWDPETGLCYLLGAATSDCPQNTQVTLEGILVDALSGLPVDQACCTQVDGFSWTINGPHGSSGVCLKDDFTPPVGPCDLLFSDIIYVDDTVVYDGSIIIEPEGIEGCTDLAADNYDPLANIDDGSCIYDGWGPPVGEDCVLLDSWTRGFVSDTPTSNYGPPEDDSVGSNTSDPDTLIQYTQGTYLLTLNTSDVALASSLQVGDEIEISGIAELTSSDPCYDMGINPSLNGVAKIAKIIYDPNNASTVKIVTNFNITNFVTATSALGFCVVQDTDGIACPVFLNQETLGCTDPTALNYNPNATQDDGSCTYDTDPPPPPVGCDCNSIAQFDGYFFQHPGLLNSSLLYTPLGYSGPVNPWFNPPPGGQFQLCNQTFNDSYYLVIDVGSAQIANFNYTPGQSICDTIELSSSFWTNLQSSCFAPYVNTTPQPLTVLARDGLDATPTGAIGTQGTLWISLELPSAGVNALGLNFGGTYDCPTIQDGDYCICQAGNNLGGGGGNKSAGIFVGPSGNAVPKSPVGHHTPIIPIAKPPCGPEEPTTPEEPSPNNSFQNLSEDCCLTLGADFGWQYIDGVCYWNPPTPTTATEFGLSENDIIVEDIGCINLEIKASFYLERPDTVECENDDGNDITASLVVYTGDSMDNTVIQTNVVSTFSLAADGYCQWTDLSSTIVNDFSTPFKVKLVLNGVKECCEYDIFVDDIQVNCVKQDIITTNNYFSCPGFKLNRIIDNKKSWVNNIETPINRTFAPSPDADIPWRYTDYFKQSGVYEKDSRLVLNSKEVDLIFNMRRKEKPCPNGYTYNPNGDNCYKPILVCPDGYTLSGDTCYSGVTTTSATTSVTIVSRNEDSCNIDLSVFDLIKYKKNFQNYWVKFIEQFIPATTIFVSGEKWSNRDNEICPTMEDCDYDNIFTKSDLGLKSVGGNLKGLQNKNTNKKSTVHSSDDTVESEKNGDYSNNNNKGPIILPGFVGSFLMRNTSVLNSGLLTLKRGELSLLSKGKQKYQNKFLPKTIVFNN